MRKYEHGMRWAFWRWTSVVKDGHEYLRRLHLLKTPWFSVMLHWIKGPDPDRDLHDHPVPFVSFVLRGGYLEERQVGNICPPFGQRVVLRRIQWLNAMRATDCHRIVGVRPGTITLVFAGRKAREWGYHTEQGFMSWRDYQR